MRAVADDSVATCLTQWRNDGVAAASSDGGALVVGGPRQF